jgi:flagellar protein FliO/FliZ
MILDVLLYLLLFAVLGIAGFFGFIFLRAHLNGESGTGSFFGAKPERRLDVVEQWSIDARRKLILIRRDDVEHLIMTGGPVDVIIETGIGQPLARPVVAPSEPIFSRPARGLAPVPHEPCPVASVARAYDAAPAVTPNGDGTQRNQGRT